MEKYIVDPLFAQKLKISQPDNGYRYSLDPFILAHKVAVSDNEKIIDVGCGCGIISLLLADRHPNIDITGIEIQKELAQFAKQNVRANKLNHNINIIEADINTFTLDQKNKKIDVMVANPPYKKKDSGRLNPDRQRAIARHEIRLDIDQLFECANRLLNKKGRFYLIFPSERLPDLIFAMQQAQLFLHTLQFIYIKPDMNARRVVICAGKSIKEPCCIRPPFYLYDSKNRYSDEYVSLFRPDQA